MRNREAADWPFVVAMLEDPVEAPLEVEPAKTNGIGSWPQNGLAKPGFPRIAPAPPVIDIVAGRCYRQNLAARLEHAIDLFHDGTRFTHLLKEAADTDHVDRAPFQRQGSG